MGPGALSHRAGAGEGSRVGMRGVWPSRCLPPNPTPHPKLMWERKLLCYPWLKRNWIVPFSEKKTEEQRKDLSRLWVKKNEIKNRKRGMCLKYGRNP